MTRNPYRAPDFPKPAVLEEPARFYLRERTVWDDIAESIAREQDRWVAELTAGSPDAGEDDRGLLV